MARFVGNYLAEATSSTISPRMCDARGACTNGTVCVGHSSKNVGECHASTTKYVVALSTRLSFDAKSGAWSVRAPRDAVEKNAPLWTESNWSPSIGAALVPRRGDRECRCGGEAEAQAEPKAEAGRLVFGRALTRQCRRRARALIHHAHFLVRRLAVEARLDLTDLLQVL